MQGPSHGRIKKELGVGRRVGLARALSKLGLCSRSRAAELIRSGRVRLNGAIRRDPETPVHLGKDRMEIDGDPVRAAAKVYFALNKPRGIVTTAADEMGRQTVYDCLRTSTGPAGDRGAGTATVTRTEAWLAPVGRLDKASEGLILITNDSEWAARITSPATHLEKTYHVQIATVADDALLAALRKGLRSNGEELRLLRVEILRQGERNSWLAITLDEGKNRHIRRMFEALGLDVLRLMRVAIGPLTLGGLAKGAHRALTAAEMSALDCAVYLSKPR